jgi:transmembrane sensor
MSPQKNPFDTGQSETRMSRYLFLTQLLQRYFSGKASAKEKQIVDAWDAQSAWEKQQSKVDNRAMDAACEEVWNNISRQLQFRKKHSTFHFQPRALSLYAAVALLFLVLGGGLFYTIQNHSTEQLYERMADAVVQTTDVQMKEFSLPDDTKIHLNRGSRLSFNTHTYNDRQREVFLEGEAYFDVTKNPEKPFIIHTGKMQTTVRGTSFNIKAYPQLNENVVSVRTGKVEIRLKDHLLAVLTKDKQMSYNRITNKFETSDVLGDDAAAWKSGELVLNYANRDELKMRLKQQYGVDVQFRNSALDGIRIKFTFVKRTSLHEVLNTLNALYGVTFSMQNKQIIINKN